MVDFNELIGKHLYRQGKGKAVGRYWPSEAGACLRKAWFAFKTPKETPVDVLMVFEAGNLVHDFVAEVLRSEKTPEVELLKSEVPIRIEPAGKGFIISGRVDDVIQLRADGKTYLVEVKSTKSIAYQKTPAVSHARQLQLYMHATGIHNGIVLYIEKNTLQARWFEVGYDPGVVDECIGRFEKLHKALIDDGMPEPEARQNREMNWMCNYCDYREECDGEVSAGLSGAAGVQSAGRQGA